MMNCQEDGPLLGLKFFGSDDSVLLATGAIDEPCWRENCQVSSFTIKTDERLIGLKLNGVGGNLAAFFFNLEWIVGCDPALSTLF